MMKTSFVTLLLIGLLASVVYADETGSFGISVADRKPLQAQIKTALTRQLPGTRLERFRVDWSPEAMRCLRVQAEMDPDADMGVCVVSASAFQVNAKVALVKKLKGYSVSIIYADVE